MKKLNNSGIAHLMLIVVLIVAVAAFGTFKLVQRAQAGHTLGDKVTCVIDAPNTISGASKYDVNVYITNNTNDTYMPHPVLSVQLFDSNGAPTQVITSDFGFQNVAAHASAVKNTLGSGQWSLTAPSTKAIYTLRDTGSAASCTKTVVSS